MNLHELQATPAKFRDALVIDVDAAPIRYGPNLDPWQRADFKALDPAWQGVVTGKPAACQRAWIERPRGHSKTNDLAVMIAWALFAAKRQITGYAAAADKDQAKLLRDAIQRLVRLNPWLSHVLKVNDWKVINPRTGSTLEILSSDAPTSYGLLADFIICDEVVHWRNRDLWDSLLSTAAKRARCLVVCITNAGWGETWQFDVREAIRTDADWYFARLEGPVASWISQRHLAEQRRLLPAIAYERLWLNRWSLGSGDAIAESDLTAALRLKGPLRTAKPGWLFVAGLDLGLSRDAAALAVVGCHRGFTTETAVPPPPMTPALRAMVENGLLEERLPEFTYETVPGTGRLRLARLYVWHPPQGGKVELEPIEQTIAATHAALNLHSVGADPWQAQYLIERLQKRGVPIDAVDQTGPNLKSMCSATLEAFAERNIELYPQPQLVQDLRNLRVIEKSYGVRLESPRGPTGHGDAATALAIALHLLRNLQIGIARYHSDATLIAS